ncbi:hypothetical protein [Geodermatophilus amargosae]|uniref:hypothetical protein n=1 Tax=Geodermatophilus amargosae TaxID=1296565 RepID=UPI0034E01FA2
MSFSPAFQAHLTELICMKAVDEAAERTTNGDPSTAENVLYDWELEASECVDPVDERSARQARPLPRFEREMGL